MSKIWMKKGTTNFLRRLYVIDILLCRVRINFWFFTGFGIWVQKWRSGFFSSIFWKTTSKGSRFSWRTLNRKTYFLSGTLKKLKNQLKANNILILVLVEWSNVFFLLVFPNDYEFVHDYLTTIFRFVLNFLCQIPLYKVQYILQSKIKSTDGYSRIKRIWIKNTIRKK